MIPKSANSRSKAAYLTLAIVTFFIFGECLFHVYGLTDDYALFFNYQYAGILPSKSDFVAEGRPVFAFLFFWVSFFAQTVSGFAVPRLISLIGLIWLSVLVCREIKASGIGPFRSVAYSVLTLATPPIAVFAGWATTFPFPASACVCLILGCFANRVLFDDTISWRDKIGRLVLIVFGVIFFGFCIYQPTAVFFLLPIVVKSLGQHGRRPDFFVWAINIAVYAISMIGYFVIYKAYAPLLTNTRNLDRSELVTDVGAKLEFFVSKPLIWMVSSWSQFYPGFWKQAYCSVVLFLCFVLFLRLVFQKKYWALVLVVATFAIANAPILMTAKDYAPFRTLTFQAWLILFLAVQGFETLQNIKPSLWLQKSFHVVAATLVIGVVFLSRYVFLEGIVYPNTREVANVRKVVEKFHVLPPEIHYIRPAHNELGASDILHCHEFGHCSSWLSWVPNGLYTMLAYEHLELFDKYPDRHNRPSVQSIQYEYYPDYLPDDAFVIDGFEAATGRKRFFHQPGRGESISHEYLGELEKTDVSDDIYFHKKMGYFKLVDSKTVIHYLLGKLTYKQKEPKGHLIESERWGQIFAVKEDLTCLYLFRAGNWASLRGYHDGNYYFESFGKRTPVTPLEDFWPGDLLKNNS